jgi:hypothetical protein
MWSRRRLSVALRAFRFDLCFITCLTELSESLWGHFDSAYRNAVDHVSIAFRVGPIADIDNF